jgi:hypothetical protein
MAIGLSCADIFDQSLALIDITRELHRRAVWARADRRRPVHGASDNGEDLTSLIRAKIAAGRLPRAHVEKPRTGFGFDRLCSGCAVAITVEQREYEFYAPGHGTICLHAQCWEIWSIEGLKLQPIQGASDSSSLNTSAVRIASILRDGFPAGYCVECLAAKLSISITEVRGAAQLLVARPGFRVCDHVCYTCGRTKDGVVAFVAGRSAEQRRPDEAPPRDAGR